MGEFKEFFVKHPLSGAAVRMLAVSEESAVVRLAAIVEVRQQELARRRRRAIQSTKRGH